MFGKRRCSKCDKKIGKDFEFCPYCGFQIQDGEDYGLLGKSDFEKNTPNNFIGKMGNSIFEKMLSSAMKMVEKEMQKVNQNPLGEAKSVPINQSNFELFINGKRVKLPGNIAGLQIEEVPQPRENSKKVQIPKISEEVLKKSAKLPRKEAKTKLMRTSDKIIYELDTPGLNSLNNILINKLEDAIEVKAYTEKAVFHKTLPVKLPLVKYSINPGEGKLFLEFNLQ